MKGRQEGMVVMSRNELSIEMSIEGRPSAVLTWKWRDVQ